MNTALLATFHASALNLLEIVAGLAVVAALLLLTVAPRRNH